MPARTRLNQVLVLVAGLGMTGLMVLLGIWQLDVYEAQGQQAADRRAAGAPVPLLEVAPPGAPVRDGYGRAVSMQGRYLPALQLLVPVAGKPDQYRVLSALRRTDGATVAVVRGVVTVRSVPDAPTGVVEDTGVLLPSEDVSTRDTAGELGSVRIPALAQRWPAPLVDGYVTLSAESARAHGLEPAQLRLPSAPGRLRNGAYAAQWWVFAAFALGMTIRICRDLGLRNTPAPELAGEPGAGAT